MLKQLKYLQKKEWVFILVAIAFIVLQVWLELEIPNYMQEITFILEMPSPNMSQILEKGGCMIACAISSAITAIIVGFIAAKIATRLARRLRSLVFNKVINFSDAEIKHFSTASLITRTTNDIMQVQMIIAMGLQLLIRAPIMAIWALCKIVSTNWQWTTATAISVAFIFIIIIIIICTALPKFKKIQDLTDNLNRVTRENLTGSRVVRAFNAEGYQKQKFDKANQDINKTHLFINKFMSMMDPAMNLIMSGLPLSIYAIGSYLIYDAGAYQKLDIFHLFEFVYLIYDAGAYSNRWSLSATMQSWS